MNISLKHILGNKNVIFLFSILPIVSCNNGEVEKLMIERDSLQLACEKHEKYLNELDTLVSVLALSLDSISIAENIFYTDEDKDGMPLDKEQIMENYDDLGQVMSRQKQRIVQLEDSLQIAEQDKWNIIISSIKKSIEGQELELQTLKEKVMSKNKAIRCSQRSIQKKQSEITPVKKQNDTLPERANNTRANTVQKQDVVINECYVRIGTKKELQSVGLLTGGLLSKKKVNYENVDKSLFNLVDIRLFKTIELNSKNPKILTPQSSTNAYHFEKKGEDKTVLHIDNPTAFWSVFNFLIIQL